MPFVAGSTALSSWRHGASRCVGGRRRARRAPTARPTPAREQPRAQHRKRTHHAGRLRSLAAAPAMSRANVASRRRPAGGLLRASRRRAPCAPRRRAHAPRRRGRRLASLGEFPHGTPPRTSRATSTPRSSPTTPCRGSSNRRRRARGGSPGLQKGGWLRPITDLLESILKVRADPSRPPRALPRRFARRAEARGRRRLFPASRARHVPEP